MVLGTGRQFETNLTPRPTPAVPAKGAPKRSAPLCQLTRTIDALEGLRTSGSRLLPVAVWLQAFWLLLVISPSLLHGADVDLPEIDPKYTIRVEADTYARVRRGAYDVIALEGNCRLQQGLLVAQADEITLWVERNPLLNSQHPGKVICMLEGHARMKWGDQDGLQDERWMGRLFSVHPVSIERGREVTRYDIPNLDWSRELGVFQLAQYNQSGGDGRSAPPLLETDGQASQPQAAARIPPAAPGAQEWIPPGSVANRYGGTSNSGFLPPGGLVIPDEGAPFPANRMLAPQAESLPVPPVVAEPAFPPPGPQVTYQVPVAAPLAAKSIQFQPRSKVTTTVEFRYDPQRGESIGQIKGGFKLVVQGVQVTQPDGTITDYGTVSLEADNAVVWVRSDADVGGANQGLGIFDLTSTPDRPVELYLDGNIVFSQGNRVIYADRMYYNVSSEYGMVLSAEVLTPVPQYQGLLRLKADVLQQQDSKNFKAFGAAVTSSRLGVPSYWLQSNELEFSDNRTETDLSVFAPLQPNRPSNLRATARSNHAYVGGVPVFYWPTFSTDLTKPSFYLTSLRFKNDSIFGTQVYSEFDAYQLLGLSPPDGSDWRVSLDYLSDRGPAFGTSFDCNGPSWLFGIPTTGYSDSWFIRDSGLDYLGVGRFGLVPSTENRGRSYSRYRLFPSPNWELMLESGWISDGNFLEQYFENEWEQNKDLATAIQARRYNGIRMFDISGQIRVNDFFTETEWFPKIEHYWLGQDLFNQTFTWSAHSDVGYGKQRTASTPTDPADAADFALLPWETNSEGIRAATRQELSLPMALGAWKVIPFLSGEAAFWSEDVNQQDVTRLTGQAGIRTALPMWRVYPNIENRLFDLRGIAHKMTWESEFFYADSNQDFERFPLYDPLDDNVQEHFRRRFVFNTFGGTLPPQFDERSYAIRTGMQRWVTAGSTEMADDLTQMRLGLNQRWQTKRGLPGSERIVDLVSLDADLIYFPKEERDNFGENIGAMTYDFRYHVGDRLTLLSDGYADTFTEGLRTISAGAQMSRPGRGDAYIGMLSLEGPISASVLNGYVNYRMNEKWIFTGGAAFDFGSTGNIGQTLSLTRIGESALVRVGINVDPLRDNVSFNFNIEPRFLPTVRLGQLGGELVPPAGLFGLE